MYKGSAEYPILISSGVFGFKHEFDQFGRMVELLEILPALQDKFGMPIGVEFNMVNEGWIKDCYRMMMSGMRYGFNRMVDDGSLLSIHTPNNTNWSNLSDRATRKTVKGIQSLTEILPFNHLVIHADTVPPEMRVEVANIFKKSVVAFENADGRPKGYPVRTADDIKKMAKLGLKSLIDFGHVEHAGQEIIDELPAILELEYAIAAYHISAVYGRDGMHHPLSSKYGIGVLQLLNLYGSNMNGRPRVLESPIQLGNDSLTFLSEEINLLLKPELGLVQ